MKAGDVFYPKISVRRYGQPVLGLVIGDFTLTGSNGASSASVSATLSADLGGGDYRLAVTSFGTAGWHNYNFASSRGNCYPSNLGGWVCAQDNDSVYSIAVRPVAVQSMSGALASRIDLTGIAYRYTPYTINVTDQTGAVYDLSGFNNFRFTVWDKLHATTVYSLSTVTGSAGGVLAWNVPEAASYFAQIDAAIAAGTDPITLYYDVIADAAATAAKTETIVWGSLTLGRYEGAA